MGKEQAAAELRARITSVDPTLLDVIDGLKATFGARLKHIRLGNYEAGDSKNDVAGIIPAKYETPKASKQGSLRGWLKEQEDAHLEANAPKQTRAGTGGRAARGPRR